MRPRKILLVAFSVAAVLAVLMLFLIPPILRSFFYPKAHGLPPVVAEMTEQLLSHLQNVLETNASIVAQSLQAGLSEAHISELEAAAGLRLSQELRALYRWHNGMSTNATVGLLPGQRFVPFDEAVAERALTRRQLASGTLGERASYRVFAGHRKSWLRVLDDGAGDGYFYDHQRADAEGAFFCHMAEEGYYLWFPSVRNFLAGVIECYQTQAVKLGTDGKHLEEDARRTEKVWARLGKEKES